MRNVSPDIIIIIIMSGKKWLHPNTHFNATGQQAHDKETYAVIRLHNIFGFWWSQSHKVLRWLGREPWQIALWTTANRGFTTLAQVIGKKVPGAKPDQANYTCFRMQTRFLQMKMNLEPFIRQALPFSFAVGGKSVSVWVHSINLDPICTWYKHAICIWIDYLDNDNRLTPFSFTPGINERSPHLDSACTVIESQYSN